MTLKELLYSKNLGTTNDRLADKHRNIHTGQNWELPSLVESSHDEMSGLLTAT
jgi:hypothetical protein